MNEPRGEKKQHFIKIMLRRIRQTTERIVLMSFYIDTYLV